jgi:hypothetical protein
MERMRTTARWVLPAVALGLTAPAVLAASNIASGWEYTWGENIGWMNWADANARANGVEIYHTGLVQRLEGWIWAENIGWINTGNGNAPYLNLTGGDFGVNLNPANGRLTGYAWSENHGWINFGPFPNVTPANAARWDYNLHRSFGWVWGENLGWININDAIRYICSIPGDVDNNGTVNVFDFGIIAGNFGATGLPPFTGGDTDGDGDVDVFDFSNLAANFGDNC